MRRLVRGVAWSVVATVLAIFAAGIVVGLALMSPVRAHGDAAWIAAEPRYVDANGSHCCGISDCKRELAMYFRESPEGIWVTSIGDFGEPRESLMPRKLVRNGLYGSVDDDWWICVRGGVVKCVFKPTSGM